MPMMTAPAFAGAFSQPTGLAVDSSGSLYVANQFSSKVLVFDKNFAPQPQLTITAGLNQPISLAIDPAPVFAQKGTLYVGNIGGAARITTYTLGGTQFTGTTFPAFRPYALAIGGDHVLYDFDNAATLNIYNTTFGSAILQSYPSASMQFTPGLGAIGSDNGLFYIGDGKTILQYPEAMLYANHPAAGFFPITGTGPIAVSTFAMNFDNFHNAFTTDPTGNAIVAARAAVGAVTLIKNLPSFPSGIALDKARNRLFVSFPSTNTVNVYKITYDGNNVPLTATLLKTLN
ncbi:MAG: hypothetical protein ACLPSF_10740 [Methylocella sp.]